jgi:lipoic acid synthetase
LSSSELQTKKKPSWLKVKFPSHQNYFSVANLLKQEELHTICQSAKCPNISECWTHRTATFLILGDTCTRNCAFCAVKKGIPSPPSEDEASRIAEAASILGLCYVVITSVTRDDLPDGGASCFAETIKIVRKKIDTVKVEVLVPDFKGSDEALMTVIAAQPDVLNHNVEVPESLYPAIKRPKKNYRRTLRMLKRAKEFGAITKSGMMIGLGETNKDILQTFSDLRQASCSLLTLGQYLQPTNNNAHVKKYYPPLEFEQLKKIALDFGFEEVEAGPLVRSSYRAHRMYSTFIEKRAN